MNELDESIFFNFLFFFYENFDLKFVPADNWDHNHQPLRKSIIIVKIM